MKILSKDWEFNVLGVDNFKRPGKLKPYYDYIRENHRILDGDICEGVMCGIISHNPPKYQGGTKVLKLEGSIATLDLDTPEDWENWRNK